MLVLGIESSCDETSAALVENGKDVLANSTVSSLKSHQRYKGIIPEIASRAHIECVSLVTARALEKAEKEIKDVDLIAVTQGPGLVGSLLVGISFAKALSLALKKPLIGINHLQAHLYSAFLSRVSQGQRPSLPFVGLVVSGGHTSLFWVGEGFSFRRISSTVDDAAGEAFDKVARLLDLGYPGGPAIEKTALKGNPDNIRFSCQGPDDLGFSFSGIKTAVLYHKTRTVHRAPNPVHRTPHTAPRTPHTAHRNITDADLAASFQKAVVDVLIEKSLLACNRKKSRALVIGGGVAANNYLRLRFEKEAASRGVRVFFPSLELALDNAAMIAGLGYQLFKRGKKSGYYLNAEPTV